jgi:hypothetical protein
VLAVVLAACSPAQARADFYANPWAGLVFGNEQAASGFRSFGVSFGDMGTRLVGTETTVGFTSDFFGSAVKNYVLDVSGGITVGPSLDTARARVHPYGSVGLASMRTSINGAGTIGKATRADIGMSVGAGVAFDFNGTLGLRGDLRYYRSFNGDTALNSLNADLAKLHYWRAAIGVVFW